MTAVQVKGFISYGALVAVGAIALSGGALYMASGRNVSAAPEVASNQYDISAYDNGKSFSFNQWERFTVRLSSKKYDPAALACEPAGVITELSSSTVAVRAPLVASRFQASGDGSCTLTNGDFSVNIRVNGDDGEAKSGIAGMVTQGPMCPVMSQERPCPNQPYQTVVTVYKADDLSKAIAKTESNDKGMFIMPLKPGEYIVKAGTDAPLPRCNFARVFVDENSLSHTMLECDTGIR